MQILIGYIVPGLWALFYAIWMLAATRAKENQQSEPLFSRILSLLVIVLGFALLFTGRYQSGALALRFVPQTLDWALAGCFIEALGIGFALIARLYLGRNWSGIVAIKVDQQLIPRGPYSLTRHPIYTGMLVAALGSAIAIGEVGGLLGLVLITTGFLLKVHLEEIYLSQQFGSKYAAYRQHVKTLIPFLW